MGLKGSLIFLLILSACGPEVHLVPESPYIYQECDRLCKKKYGENVSVFSTKQSISKDDFICYCK